MIGLEFLDKDNIIRTTSAVTTSVVTTLNHEVLYDTVEFAALVPLTLLALGELNKVLSSLGNSLAENTNHNTACLLIADFDVEPHL